MTEGKDTTDRSISSDPGSSYGLDVQGNIVPVPEPRVPGPSVDKEDITEDHGEVTELVEEATEQQEDKETGGIATG